MKTTTTAVKAVQGKKETNKTTRTMEQIKQGSRDLAKAMGKTGSVVDAPATALAIDSTISAKDALAKAKANLEEAKAKAKAIAQEAKKIMDETKAEARIKREAELKAKKEAQAAAKVVLVPDMVAQLDEHGIVEMIDKNVFKHEVHCSKEGCTEVRYVTTSGLLEVTMCKPHARKERRARRLSRVKARNTNYKAIVEEAIAKGLFPDTFMKQYGLV